MNSRRLVLVTDYGPPYIGGMETHAVAVARTFSEEGLLAGTLLLPLSKPDEDAARFAQASATDTPIATLAQDSIRNASFFIETLDKLGVPDDALLFFNSLYWIRILPELKVRRPRVRIALRSGGNDVLQARITGEGETLAERQAFIARAIRDSVDLCIVNSEFSRERSKTLGIPDERMRVVRGGVDVERFAPATLERKARARTELGLPSDAMIVLAACRLVPFKGLEDAFKALARLPDTPKLVYVIVGDGPERTRLETLASTLGLGNIVRFAGAVPHEEIPRYFEAADMYFLMPRLAVETEPGGTYVHTETMGRSFCEALSAGLAVVASNVGGIPEIVHDGREGIIVPEGDAESAARALDLLLHDAPRRDALARAGRERAVSEYGWSTVCARYRELFSL